MGKPMGVRLRCKQCGSEVVINQVERQWATCNGKRLLLTMHVCGECDSVNVLQVDDEGTIKLFDKIRTIVAIRAQLHGGENQAGLFRKLNKKLDKQRKDLIKSYVGKPVKFIDIDRTLPDGWVMAV